VTPILFGVLDDRSRLACHLQWYLAETAELIAHGLSQAFQKRGLPRSAPRSRDPRLRGRVRWQPVAHAQRRCAVPQDRDQHHDRGNVDLGAEKAQ
jgi:hypothetical protein